MATSWNGSSLALAGESYITLITVLAVTVLWLLWSVSSYFRYRNRLPLPPGNFGFPIIGQTVEYLLAMRTADGIRQWVQKKVDKHGPIFKYRFVGYPMVILDQPEGNKFIFQNEGTTNHMFFPSHMYALLGPHSLAVQTGDNHKLLRRYLNRFFDHTAMSRYIPGVNRIAMRHLTSHWQGKEQLVGLEMTLLYTFSVICNLAVSLKEGPLMDKIREEFHTWAQGGFSVPINLPGFRYYKALKARKSILKVLDGLLEQRRKEIAEDRVPEASQTDMLTNMLTVPDGEGNLLSDSFIKDNLFVLLLAGFDTSGNTLAMTMFYIAKHPHVYNEIIEEHKLIREEKRRSGKDENAVTMEDISSMKYTWNVIQETLRLHPVLVGTYRKTVTDLEYKGYYIPKGWVLNWNNQHSHFNSKYFKDPLKFDPSRWQTRPPPFTYLPFSGGPHTCIGNEFAKMSMLVFIHHLVRNYSWSLVDPSYDGPFIRDPLSRTPDRVSVTVKQLTAF
ncbi:hypothetical protein R1sor_001777 [Riccia sorocarpa]|uniref:Cytochrome P450 n=1 Tax=Riccia sorocarpa TaxID=122646 RepID=A0ABD3H0A5_9MARC